ncbi:MAG TPA: YncE family protein [Candidatus Methylomirabilis sp.]|nr:YncE family protein [Candidatus Methylomirabilis sp.]
MSSHVNRQRYGLGGSGLTILLTLLLMLLPSAAGAQLMIIGNDEKVSFDDAGQFVFSAPGKDTVSIVDIGSNPESPKIIINLPLMNSIFGPPVNLAITPDERLAIVANSVAWVQDQAAWKPVPDDKLYVIDLKASPPRLIATVQVGRQPSGLSINGRGDLALVTNREDKTISVLSIHQDEVKVVGTVPMGDSVAQVVFTPDGKRALAVKFPAHKVALLEVDGEKVTYTKYDMPVGLWPYNIDVTPNGKLALTADNGNVGRSDGHIDTVSVIDLETNPPRVIDRVVVGDAPEGLVISPTGEIAVAMLLRGNDGPKQSWFYNRKGRLAVLKIDGKTVTKVGEVEVGSLPEGAVFSQDGKYLYVGNYLDRDVSILKVEGTKITDTGKRLQLPGHPASMRGRTR